MSQDGKRPGNQSDGVTPNQRPENVPDFGDEGPNPEMAARLRQATQEAGGPTAVSATSGVPLRNLQRYLAGDAEMKASAVARLAVATGVNVEWLLTGQGAARGARSTSPTPSLDQYAADNAIRAFDAEVLKAAVIGVEEHLTERGKRLAVDKKAEVIALVYTARIREKIAGIEGDSSLIEQLVKLAS